MYGERRPTDIFGDYYLSRRELSRQERVAIQLLHSPLRWRVAEWFLRHHPEFFLERLSQTLKPAASMEIDVVLKQQRKLQGFEDLAPLFLPL